MMMRTIRQWWTDRKAQARENELENIKKDFKVFENGGKLYLTHNGYAFAVMPSHATADEIAAKLNEARKAAMEFEGL